MGELGINPDASEGTKGRFAFPFGDFAKVNRAALIHVKQRPSQNDHSAIEKAAEGLLRRLDEKRSYGLVGGTRRYREAPDADVPVG